MAAASPTDGATARRFPCSSGMTTPVRPGAAGQTALRRRTRLDWRVQFVLLASIWGLSFLFIKLADRDLDPLQVALGRVGIGGATLLLVLLLTRRGLPRGPRTWLHLAVSALLVNAVPFFLFAYAETQVTSIAAGIWNAVTPLLTLTVVLVALPAERPNRQRLLGLAAGFLGVLVVLGPWRGLGGAQLLGNLACLGAAAGYAVGFPYTRRFLAGRPESSAALSAGQLLCATVELGIPTALFTHAPYALEAGPALSVLALGALGTGVAYILNYGVIRAAGATTATTVTYLIPVIATLAGVVALREPLTWNQPVGGAIIVAALAVAQGHVRLNRGAPSPS